MHKILKSIALAIVFLGGGNAVAQTTINASGDGWCSISACNNVNTSVLQNTYANEVAGFRDWFAFTVSAPVSDALISIWQVGTSTGDNTSIYTVRSADAINFNDLASGTALGSVSYADAWNGTGHYVDIDLGAAGAAYINSHIGSTILFGGSTQGNYAEFFGGPRGTPVARLIVTPVPEPAHYAMLLAGIALLGSLARRRRPE